MHIIVLNDLVLGAILLAAPVVLDGEGEAAVADSLCLRCLAVPAVASLQQVASEVAVVAKVIVV